MAFSFSRSYLTASGQAVIFKKFNLGTTEASWIMFKPAF